MASKNILMIGVVGPTCSGKTTVSNLISSALGSKCSVLSQDNFYFGGNKEKNYDEPDAIDFQLLIDQVNKLKNGVTVDVPNYDFKTHSRTDKTTKFAPNDVIIIEGILLYCHPELVDLLDIKIYIKSDPFDRKKRRIQRDVSERGRDKYEVIQRYERDVEPSNEKFVEPSQKFASNFLIDNCNFTFQGMDTLLSDVNKAIGLPYLQKEN